MCICLRCVYGILSYNVGDGCTIKNKIICIRFQLLIFPLPFRCRFFTFSISVIVNGITFYPLRNEYVYVTVNTNHTACCSAAAEECTALPKSVNTRLCNG